MTEVAHGLTAGQATFRKRLFLLLKIVVSVAAFALLFRVVKPADLASAISRVSLGAFSLAVLAALVAIGFGTLRWWVLLDAYGATARPPLTRLFRLTIVGHFYNTLLPGAVGGDVLRGFATRDAFGERNATAGVAVTLVERVLGLAVLLVVTGTLSLVHPLPGVHGVLPLSFLGIAAAACALAVISLGWRLGPKLPGKLGQFVGRLPRIVKPGVFLFALLLSFGTQLSAVLGIYPILHALAPQVSLLQTASLVPIALAASYFPFTVGGAGAREGAFVALLGAIGVAHPDAMASSLLAFAAQAVIAACGGLLHLVWPLDSDGK